MSKEFSVASTPAFFARLSPPEFMTDRFVVYQIPWENADVSKLPLLTWVTQVKCHTYPAMLGEVCVLQHLLACPL